MLLCCRSLQAELASVTEDIAAYVENLNVKNEIVQSLTVELANLQGSSGQSNGSCGQLEMGSCSDSAHTLVETTRRLELLTVFH